MKQISFLSYLRYYSTVSKILGIMFAIQYVLAIAAAFLGSAVAEEALGFYGDNSISNSTFDCLRQNYTFYIGSIVDMYVTYDTVVAQNMKNADDGNRRERESRPLTKYPINPFL